MVDLFQLAHFDMSNAGKQQMEKCQAQFLEVKHLSLGISCPRNFQLDFDMQNLSLEDLLFCLDILLTR